MIPNYSKEYLKVFAKNIGYKYSLTALYGFIVILIFIGAFFLPVTLVISVPLVLLPLTFGYISANASINVGNPHPYQMMFIFYGKYFKDAFFGCFRSLFALLKGVIVYFGVSMIISIITTVWLMNTSPEFVQLITNMSELSIETLERYMQEIEAIPGYTLAMFINFTVSFGLAAYIFNHHLLTNAVKYFFLFSSANPTSYKEINYVHRFAFKKFRKIFYFNYYQVGLFMFLLFFGGYVGGVLLSYYLFNLGSIQASVVGLFGGFILNLFLLPLILDDMCVTFNHNRLLYAEALVEIASKAFNELKDDKDFSEEDKKKTEEFIKKSQEDINEFKKEESKKDEENKK